MTNILEVLLNDCLFSMIGVVRKKWYEYTNLCVNLRERNE